jgi:hypothetical protein
LDSVQTESLGEIVIWVDAKTLVKPLFCEKERKFGTLENNPQAVLRVSGEGFVKGDTEFTRVAIANR